MDSKRRARRPRKQLRNEPNWKRNKRKDLRNKGQEYELLLKDPEKQHVAAKQMGRSCDCSLHYWDRVNGENRQKLFSGFFSVGSYGLQNTYLVGCIKFCLLSAAMVPAIGAGIRTSIMSMSVVSLCVCSKKPFLVSMLCHMAV